VKVLICWMNDVEAWKILTNPASTQNLRKLEFSEVPDFSTPWGLLRRIPAKS